MLPKSKPFAFKSRPNGEVLKFYHDAQNTSTGSSSQNETISFVQACFDASNQLCATIDNRSRLYVIDVQRTMYKKLLLPSGSQEATAICFHSHIPSTVLVGTEAGEVMMMNAETGRTLENHIAKIISARPIQQFVWPKLLPKESHLLILTQHEVHHVHSATFERIRKHVNLDRQHFGQLLFSAADDTIYGITNRKALIVWPPTDVVEPIVAFDAVRLKQNFLRTNPVTSIGSADANEPLRTTNAFDDTIRHVDVRASDGKLMCVCSDDGVLILHRQRRDSASTFHWKAQQFWQLDGTSKHLRCLFVPANIEAHQRLLFVVTTTTGVCLVDASGLRCQRMLVVEQPAVISLTTHVSPFGDWIAVIASHRHRGEYRLFSVTRITAAFAELDSALQSRVDRQRAGTLHDQLAQILTPGRLARQLAEFHEYPREFRPLFWHTVLRLPRSRHAFERLQRLGAHPCTAHFATTYPLKDRTAGRHLVRIVSALAHWCPALGHAAAAWLPRFVFPFLRVYPHDVHGAFETVATLLLNHGQLWLEFSAAVPPLNYLAVCDQLLAHFVPRLHAFYATNAVPAALYVGSLTEAAFTEVLDEKQWLRLWDHVCSRPAWWLPFVLVAFNKMMWRGGDAAAAGRAECELLFGQHASQVDIGRLAALADRWAAECPSQLHPRQYLHAFRELGVDDALGDDGCGYRAFTKYPRFVADDRRAGASADGTVERLDAARFVNARLLEMERLKGSMEERMAASGRLMEHDRRLAEAERVYEATVRSLESISMTKF